MHKRENITLIFNSLIEHGGGSYNFEKGVLNPDSGYMVAVKGCEKIVDMPTDAEAFRDVLIKYASDHPDELFSANNYLGVWREPNSGKVYLDISERVFDKEEAMRLGCERAQIAIFDNAAREVISVRYAYVDNIFNSTNIHTKKTI